MTNSDEPDEVALSREQRRADRVAGVKRWVRHIEETPPEQWGAEQNAVVNAQVDAARKSEVDADHRRRVRRVARELSDDDRS